MAATQLKWGEGLSQNVFESRMHRETIPVLSRATNLGLRHCLASWERAAEGSAQPKLGRIKSENFQGGERIGSGRKAATAS